ncbi:uncharacterized protein LOC131881122 [Tigriopus californicus]|uniref:uncharacterized protein LOC131881122 n=1 Tax=Tigriopus californicus TaxID=6832 RepID=UPI0027DA0640|nr:uncharacterized protein LOC131881122 [Tigriopus californicus]
MIIRRKTANINHLRWTQAFIIGVLCLFSIELSTTEAETLVNPRAKAHARRQRNIHDFLEGGDHNHDGANQLDADDPDFSGVVDFSNAEPGPGGSWCITKTKYVDHMVKDQIKECWHQNITQCHDTYVTEFLPSQEQKCEETFWKSCKIDFREMPYNYTMKSCHTPLMKICDQDAAFGKPEIVCKTWFESECNTTYTETTPNVEDKPNTWCKKVPRKICAPDNCKMVPGPEECHDKTLVSTIEKPTELCDLQPTQHCRLITKLTPHLLSKEVCKNIPKEVCHLALTAPKQIKKPLTLKWCTRKGGSNGQGQRAPQANNNIPTYTRKPSYLPPPPPPLPQSQNNQRGVQVNLNSNSGSSSNNNNNNIISNNNNNNNNNNNFIPQPTYGSPSRQPIQNFQLDNAAYASSPEVQVTKFKPRPQERDRPNAFQPVYQEQARPAASIRNRQTIQLPDVFREELIKVISEEELERALAAEEISIIDESVEEDESQSEEDIPKVVIPPPSHLNERPPIFSASITDEVDSTGPGLGSFGSFANVNSGGEEYLG